MTTWPDTGWSNGGDILISMSGKLNFGQMLQTITVEMTNFLPDRAFCPFWAAAAAAAFVQHPK